MHPFLPPAWKTLGMNLEPIKPRFQTQLVNSQALWLWTGHLISLSLPSFSDSLTSVYTRRIWGGLNSMPWVWAQPIVSRSPGCVVGADTAAIRKAPPSRGEHRPLAWVGLAIRTQCIYVSSLSLLGAGRIGPERNSHLCKS